MAVNSSIEWTHRTWNPVTGCTKISPGCRNCYAELMARRLQGIGQKKYANGFKVTIHHELLSEPAKWKKPMKVFVNSMSDLFHDEVPLGFIRELFEVMGEARNHIFQILTKRSLRLRELSARLDWPSNVWMGVTVENQDYTSRIEHLRQTGARIKFLCLEPLLGPIRGMDLSNIDWVIVGGESGPRARPISEEWVRLVRAQCLAASVPFFFKQWGGRNKKKAGRLLDGRTWDDTPRLTVG